MRNILVLIFLLLSLAAPAQQVTPTIGLIPSGSIQSVFNTGAAYVWDMFDRSNRVLNGDLSPSGGAWALSGAGFNTASITNRQFVSPANNVYAYQSNNGNIITRLAGTFNFTPGTGTNDPTQDGGTLIADNNNAATGLQTMLHLNFGPTSWALTKRISGGAFVGVLTNPQPYALLTDGTIYGISMDINVTNHTVTVTGPDGLKTTATDSDIGGAINPIFGAIQIEQLTNNFIIAWNGFEIGNTVSEPLRGLYQAAPMEEVAWLKGNGALFHQRVTASLTGGVGWYTIATQAIIGTFAVQGNIVLTVKDSSGFSQYVSVYISSDSSEVPRVGQQYDEYIGSAVLDQVRVSNNSSSFLINVDIHVQSSETPLTLISDFFGGFSPVTSPVVGATALPTNSTVFSLTQSP